MSAVLDEALLDDPDALAAADRSGTLVTLAGAGAQVRQAHAAAEEAGVSAVTADGRPRAVVVAALGGSAVVADLLSALAGAGSPVPVLAVHAPTTPAWVSPLDLVVAVSLSGRAAGPLAVAAEAARRGARLLTVGAPGSPLAEVCGRARGVHVAVAPGVRSSRAGLWSLAVPVLVAADALGLLTAGPQVMEETAGVLDEVATTARPASESFLNPAKSLALSFAGSLPLVLGAGEVAGVAALRAAGQLARNARHPALHGVLPDDAGEVVATFGGPFTARADDLFADPFLDEGPAGPRLRLALLRDAVEAEEEAVARSAAAVASTAAECGVAVEELRALPGSPLARVASLVALTDFASVYLALGLGLDPAASPRVADLKERLGP
jgi:hypothetical protein